CEVVSHQAAIPSGQRALDAPLATHEANVTGTLVLLEGARRAGVRRLVYAASSSAYGDAEVLPKREDMPARSLSPYALQKYASEVYCAQYAGLFGLQTVALRYFNVFGPRQDPRSDYAAVIPLFVSALAEGRRPTIFGDGLQSRDFTFVEDVVAANRAAAAAPAEAAGQVFNIGCGARSTLLELLEVIAEVLGVDGVEPDFQPVRPGDVRHSQADVSRAREVLGWSPRVPLREGIARTAEFMKHVVRGAA
ncbi:MAG: NAD-dependent epimerase/dehydratase family protein, partial [Myxococcota bacterium]